MARTDVDISHIPHGQTEGGRQNAFLDGQAPPLHPMTVLLPEPQYDIATIFFFVIRVKKFRRRDRDTHIKEITTSRIGNRAH